MVVKDIFNISFFSHFVLKYSIKTNYILVELSFSVPWQYFLWLLLHLQKVYNNSKQHLLKFKKVEFIKPGRKRQSKYKTCKINF